MSKPLSGFSETSRLAADTALAQPARAARRARKFDAKEGTTLQGCTLWLASEDISQPTHWEIEHDRHTLIVHLDGEMQRLETRIGRDPACREPARIGEMWLVPAGRPYVGRALGDRISYAEYHFDRNWMTALAGPARKGASVRAIMKFRDPVLHGLTGRLVQLANEGDDLSGLLRESIAQTVGLHLLREYASAHEHVAARPVVLRGCTRQRIEDYIVAHLDQRLTLDELAEVAALPPHRLIPAFRNSFGQTPLQYVIAQRLHLACRLLESTRQDIVAIAMATGFSSHSHLSHTFKQRYGLTPQQFRRRAKGYELD